MADEVGGADAVEGVAQRLDEGRAGGAVRVRTEAGDVKDGERGRCAHAHQLMGSVPPGTARATMVRCSRPEPTAPDFTLPDQDGERRLARPTCKGQTVVLYFYPKADTPGCTTQACGIRDHLPDYTAAGVRVLGVSPDPVKAVKKFHDKQALNFTLLADEDHAVCEAYGVWAEKSMYGKTYWGALRATFIIDGEGTIAHVIPKASPKTHDDEVLKALGELATA